MTRRSNLRATVLVPLVALLALARALVGPGTESLGAAARELASATASACGSDACGCEHSDPAADCCCAGSASSVEASATSVRTGELRPPSPAPEPSAWRTVEVPPTTLSPRHCGGAPRGQASFASAAPAVLSTTAALHVREAPRLRVVRREPGPPFDLVREPPTPPPRSARG